MKKILLILLLATISFAGTWEDITDVSKPITLHNIFERPMNFGGVLIQTNDYCDLGKYLKRSTINNYATVLLNDINANKFTYTNTGTLPVVDYGSTNTISGGSTDLTTISNQFLLKNNVIDMGTNNITNLADGTVAKHAVNLGQVQDMTNACLQVSNQVIVASNKGCFYSPDTTGTNGYFTTEIYPSVISNVDGRIWYDYTSLTNKLKEDGIY